MSKVIENNKKGIYLGVEDNTGKLVFGNYSGIQNHNKIVVATIEKGKG